MCAAEFAQESIFGKHVLQQRVVIEHIHRSGMLTQGLLQGREDPSHSGLREWIEEINHERVIGKREGRSIGAERFEREAFLRSALVLSQILLRDLMQGWKKFDSYDAAKGIIRRHQQSASFSRAQIDEGEVAEVENRLVRDRPPAAAH